VIDLGDLMLKVSVDSTGAIKEIRSIQTAARTAAQQQSRDLKQTEKFYQNLFAAQEKGAEDAAKKALSVQKALGAVLKNLAKQENAAIVMDRKLAAQQVANTEKRIGKELDRYRRRLGAEYASWWSQSTKAQAQVELRQSQQFSAKISQMFAQRTKRDAANYTAWWTQALNNRYGDEVAAEARAQSEKERLRQRERHNYIRMTQELYAARDATEKKALAESRARKTQEIKDAKAKEQAARRERVAAERRAEQQISATRRDQAMRRARMGAAFSRLRGGSTGLSTLGITGTVVGTMAVRGLARAIEDVQVMRQRLAQVTETAGEARVMFDELTSSASRLRVPVADTTELFVKLRQSNSQLGLSMDETLTLTNAFSAALRISGAQGQTAASSLLQFGQAMAKGKLDGDEFRTVAENASEVLRVLERQLGKNRGELLKMREAGLLTSKMIAGALILDADNLNDRVTKLAPTLTQAATVFRNSLLQMVGDSKDLETATGNLAQKIVDFGNTISENGQTITNLGAFAIKLGLVTVAARTLGGAIAALKSVPAWLLAPMIGVSAIGGSMAMMFGAKAFGEGQVADARANRIKAMTDEGKKSAKAFKEMTDQLVAAQTRFREAQQKAAQLQTLPVGPERNALGSPAEINKELRESEKAYRELAEAFTLAAKARSVLAGGGKTDEDDLVGDPTQIKDTTDAFIRAAGVLAENRELREQDFARLQAISAAEQQILQEATESTERLAEARGRVQAVADVMRTFYAENEKMPGGLDETARRVDILIDNFETLFSVMSPDDVREVIAEKDRLTNSLQNLEIATQEYADTLARVMEISELLAKVDPFGIVSGESNRRISRFNQSVTDTIEQMKQSLETEMMNLQITAPSDIFLSFLSGLGQQFAQGGTALRDQMLGTIGNIFVSMGSAMVKYGILQTKLATALLNPLTAGPAAIAIGAAMVVLGSTLSASVRSGGRNTSGTIGSGIGSLGIGGNNTMESVYRFEDRPYQSGAGRVSATSQPVIVNATIIGPNDPNAQRQIAQLVDNAARRGLMQGGGMRT
jgi:tape measure domain-containing protein